MQTTEVILENDPGMKFGDVVPSALLRKYSHAAAITRPGIQSDEVIQKYTEWSETYDTDCDPIVYRASQIASDFCNILVADQRATARVLDVAAGTGMVGYYLRRHGFMGAIDALEPSPGMLERAKKKNVYSTCYAEKINDEGVTSLEPNTYDVVILAGAMGEGHVPAEGMREVARLTRTGGYVIIVMRDEFLEYASEYKNKRLESIMRELEDDDVWTSVCWRQQVPNYAFSKTGAIFAFRKN